MVRGFRHFPILARNEGNSHMPQDASNRSESDLIVARWTVVQGTSALIALIVATAGVFLNSTSDAAPWRNGGTEASTAARRDAPIENLEGVC